MDIGVIAGQSGETITDELQRRGFKVAMVVGSEEEMGTEIVDNLLVSDLRNFAKIDTFFSKLNIKYVVIATGHRLAIALGQYLEEQGYCLSIEMKKVILCKNKYLFKKQVQKLGHCTPASILVNNNTFKEKAFSTMIDKINYPCVLKSIEDISLPQKIYCADNLKREIERTLGSEEECMVEEFINGGDCTIPVAYDGLTAKPLGIIYYSKGKEDQLKGFNDSYAVKFSAKIEKELIKDAKKIITELGITGLSRIDYIVKGERLYVLEVNGIIVTSNVDEVYTWEFLRLGINRAKYSVELALKKFLNLKALNILREKRNIVFTDVDCVKQSIVVQNTDKLIEVSLELDADEQIKIMTKTRINNEIIATKCINDELKKYVYKTEKIDKIALIKLLDENFKHLTVSSRKALLCSLFRKILLKFSADNVYVEHKFPFRRVLALAGKQLGVDIQDV